MEWDASLESDIEVIDHEHKELVGQLSHLMDESNQNRVEEMLGFLKRYVVQHFSHEQLMHKSSNYPKAAEHKQAHINFIDTFAVLEKQFYAEGSNLEMLQKVIEVVNTWLKEHIMGLDKEFAEYYKALNQTEEVAVEEFECPDTESPLTTKPTD